MTRTELFVALKIPDNTAISAFKTLQRMGFLQLQKLDRYQYYSFDHIMKDEKFRELVKNIDVLVNVNKHAAYFQLPEGTVNSIAIAVLNDEDTTHFAEKLEKLGLKGLNAVTKGVVWQMDFDPGIDAKKNAMEIAKSLLMNEHYQTFKMIG